MANLLFTVLVEYAGGTYISQVHATGPAEALTAGVSVQSDKDLVAWKLVRDELTLMFAQECPVALDGLQSIWCTTVSLDKGLLLANIVQTVSEL